MKQMTLAPAGFERYAKTTRRAEFLAQMDRVVPWGKLCALVLPVYPKAGDGRRPIELHRLDAHRLALLERYRGSHLHRPRPAIASKRPPPSQRASR